jgi:type I restriction enzyme S subunit
VGINHLGADKFSRMRIPLPPLAEQERIVTEVERRLSAITRIEKEITAALEQASQLRVSLFHCALEGKLVDQDGTDERATNLLARIRTEREGHLAKAKLKKPQRKTKMKKLSPELVKEAILKLPKERFSFDELSVTLQADYDPLKDIVFELLGEAKPSVKQVFDPKAKQIQFQRIKP